MNEFGIPDRPLYCVQCYRDTVHRPKVLLPTNDLLGGSWHYECCECGIGYFHCPARERRGKRIRFQIASLIESEQRRIRNEMLLKAFNL